MFKTEFEANQAGFSCVAIERKAMPKARKSQGVNLFKAAGYAVSLLLIVAVVF